MIIIYTFTDPISATLPFLGSAWPMNIVLISYLLFVLKFGKKFMENREPYSLKTTLIIYNVFQVIYNGAVFCTLCKSELVFSPRPNYTYVSYIILKFFISVYFLFIIRAFDFRCMESLSLDNPDKSIERLMGYLYFINKLIDLLDTIFFVLRKKQKQITFLHVFHHVYIILGVYWVNRIYGIGGQTIIIGFLNTFVHTIMYYYYMNAALFTGQQNQLWWKKYITIIQIVQFSIVFVQSAWTLFFNPGCQYPHFMQYTNLVMATTFVYMFTKFYINAYMKPKKVQKME